MGDAGLLVEYLLSANFPSFLDEPWDLRHALAGVSLSFALIPLSRYYARRSTPEFRRKAFSQRFQVDVSALKTFEFEYRKLPLEQAILAYEKQQRASVLAVNLSRGRRANEEMQRAREARAKAEKELGMDGTTSSNGEDPGSSPASSGGETNAGGQEVEGDGGVSSRRSVLVHDTGGRSRSTPAGADAYSPLGPGGYPGQFSSIMAATAVPPAEAGNLAGSSTSTGTTSFSSTSAPEAAMESSASLALADICVDATLHHALAKRRARDPFVALATYLTFQRALAKQFSQNRDSGLQAPHVNLFSHGIKPPRPWQQMYYFSLVFPWVGLAICAYFSLEYQHEKIQRKKSTEKIFQSLAGASTSDEDETAAILERVRELRTPRLRSQAFTQQSLQRQRKMVDWSLEHLQKNLLKPLPQNHPIVAHLNRLKDEILGALPKRLQNDPWIGSTKLDIIDSPAPQAFANVARVGFLTGNLARLMREDGLCFVLAHEIAHVVLRHMQEQASGMAMLQVPVNGAWFASVVYFFSRANTVYWRRGLLAMIAGFWVRNRLIELGENLHLSQQNECEADVLGLSLTTDAGYCPALAVLSGAANFDQLHLLAATQPEPDMHCRIIRAQLALADGKPVHFFRHVVCPDWIAEWLPGAATYGPAPVHDSSRTVAICNKHVKIATERFGNDPVFAEYVRKVYGMSPDMFFEKFGFACENGVNHASYLMFGESYEDDAMSFLREKSLVVSGGDDHEEGAVGALDPDGSSPSKNKVNRVDITNADQLPWGINYIAQDANPLTKIFSSHPEFADRTVLRCAAATAEMQQVLDLPPRKFEERMLRKKRTPNLPRPCPTESVEDYIPNTLDDWCLRVALGEVYVMAERLKAGGAGGDGADKGLIWHKARPSFRAPAAGEQKAWKGKGSPPKWWDESNTRPHREQFLVEGVLMGEFVGG